MGHRSISHQANVWIYYEDHKEDDSSDKDAWKEYAKDLKAFSQDFLAASSNDSEGSSVMKAWVLEEQVLMNRSGEITSSLLRVVDGPL